MQNAPYDTTNSDVFIYGDIAIFFGRTSGNNFQIRAASIDSNGNLTYGTMVEMITTTSSPGITMCYNATANAYVMAYNNPANSNFLTYRAFTLSGTTITLGTAVVISNSSNNQLVESIVGSSNVVTVYSVSGITNAQVRTISISGTTLTLNTALDTGQANNPSRSYYNSNDSKYYVSLSSTLKSFNISGTTVTNSTGYNNNAILTAGSINQISYSDVLDTVVVVVQNSIDNSMSYYTVDTGTTNTANDTLIMNKFYQAHDINTLFHFTSNFQNIMFLGKSNQTSGGLHLLAIPLNNGLCNVRRLSLNRNLTGFGKIFGNWGVIHGSHNEVSGATVIKVILVKLSNLLNYFGIASETKTANQQIKILKKDDVYNTTGLTIGKNYYVQSNGTIGTAPNGLYFGKAISTTQLLLG
jgi:hypothetical protein